MTISKEHKMIAFSQFVTAAGIVLLRLVFWLSPLTFQEVTGYRFAFDIDFPLFDAVYVVLLIVAGRSLLTGRNRGRSLSTACAGYLIYLGVVDVGIPFGGSVVAVSIVDITSNGAINLWCVVLGLYTILKFRGAVR
jgi:hypothetical protein